MGRKDSTYLLCDKGTSWKRRCTSSVIAEYKGALLHLCEWYAWEKKQVG